MNDLERAYRETLYRVLPPDGPVLRIDRHCEALAPLYQQHGVSRLAVVTAWNPLSEPTDPQANAAAQAQLAALVAEQGWPALPAVGEHPSGTWAEDSLAVLGISRPHARMLGERFRQRAVVWVGADAVPELLSLLD